MDIGAVLRHAGGAVHIGRHLISNEHNGLYSSAGSSHSGRVQDAGGCPAMCKGDSLDQWERLVLNVKAKERLCST